MSAPGRAEARREILAAANRNAVARFPRRRLQEAVFKVRQRQLVGADTLVAAGFRPERRRAR